MQPRIKPTIVIGHGAFGLAVLRHFLRKTAPRGNLIAAGLDAADGAGRRLRDLALLWMPEAEAAGPWSDVSAAISKGADDADGKADFLRDLYRQIDTVPNRPGAQSEALCDKVGEAARFLRSDGLVEARNGLDGLDVVIVAQPRQAADIVALDRMNRALLIRLMDSYPRWCEGQRAARTLHCIAILDFDNYRGGGEDGRRLRRAVRVSMEGWQRALEQADMTPRPILDRCYLLDAKAGNSDRDQASRRDETTLFLEFLLFGGIRDKDELKPLFEQGSHIESVASGFGVRALERSPPLLSRLAAARFGAGWLAYLRGDPDVRSAGQAEQLTRTLEPLLKEIEESAHARTGVGDAWAHSATGLADALLSLADMDAPDWGERAERRLVERARGLERELLQVGLAQISRLRADHLGEAGEKVIAAINADLHDSQAPVSLAAVIDVLDDALRRVRGRMAPAAAGLAIPPLTLARTHRSYLDASRLWLAEDGRGLSRLWPLLACVVGLAATPFAQDLLRQLPLLAAADSPLQKQLAIWAERLDQPLLVAPMLMLCCWGLLRLLAQPRVTGAIARARAFYRDPERGRLAAAARADSDGLSGIRERVLQNVQATLANDLAALLAALRQRLKQREQEMRWLGEQLGEFQRMFGLERGVEAVHPPADAAHRWLVDEGDLKRMMSRRPAVTGQFESRQDAMPEPFAGWNERYCHRFLDLFGFIDKLSPAYLATFRDRSDSNAIETDRTRRKQALDELLERRPDIGFRTDSDRDQGGIRRFALLPEDWFEQQGASRLPEGLEQVAGAESSRFYLLAVRLGIAAEALETVG